ncbi:MAG: VIT domain-containing protein [Planctomycetota bacterium]
MERSRAIAASLILVLLFVAPYAIAQQAEPQKNAQAMDEDVTQGALRVDRGDGKIVECPLKHTDVKADISGFIARVKVTQVFYNPFDDKIEAVYVFPLPHQSAVDDMTMVIGDRRIVGVIKRREEARYIYEQALRQGMTASLLEQERPNIFTQSVGNIKPKQEVRIEISYVDVLKYDMGVYEFHFPMVVGPRYIPGSPTGKQAGGWAPDTDRVPDASRITPPVLKPGFRTGHDISLSLILDAGVPVRDLKVESHETKIARDGDTKAAVDLSPKDSIPNKDFVLKYAVVGEKPEMAILTHRTKGDGYFMLMIQPRIDEELAKAPPREVCFLIDVSGSMHGQPTEKVKEAMRNFFELAKPDDRMQVITFAGHAQKLFDQPVPTTQDNIQKALNFTNAIDGRGGTEMLKGIKMVLNEPVDPQRVRIVVMLSDGYIGNEAEIIAEVGRRCGDSIRFWTVGIGSSPNRFLLDGVAKQGGGMSGVLALNEDATKLVREIVERIHRAQLANVRIDWARLPVYETYPVRIPELWAGRPVILYGRYEDAGKADITISGAAEGKPLRYTLPVEFPAQNPDHEVLTKVWARQKIEDLSAMAYYGDDPAVVEEITEIALQYRLMSQYTSFVAVDESEKGKIRERVQRPRSVMVPVPMPQGVSYEGVFGPIFGEDREEAKAEGMGGLLGRVGSGSRTKAKLAAPMTQPEPPPGKRVDLVTGFVDAGGMARPAAPMPGVSLKKSRGLMAFGKAAPAATAEALALAEVDERAAFRFDAQAPFLQEAATKQHEAAKKILADAEGLKKNGNLDEAVRRLQYAYLLERAFLAVNPWSDDGTGTKIMGELTDCLDKLTEERAKENPALAKTLDLVIQRRDVADALAEVSKAAGIEISIVHGSIEDATDLLLIPPRVVYMDLRGATTAQAIQWIVETCHMTWTVKDGKVIVGSARLLPGEAAWAYRVGDIANPMQDELPKDRKEVMKKYEEMLKNFLAVIQSVDPNAVLIGASDVVVFGDAAAQTKMASFLKALRDPSAPMPVEETDAVKSLRGVTAKRFASRKEGLAKQSQSLALRKVSNDLNEYAWPLLADAAVGKLNAEALAHLEEAFAAPQIPEIVKTNPICVFRTAWAIAEAAGALPKDAAVQRLAAEVREACGRNVNAIPEQVRSNLQNPFSFAAILYAALVTKDSALAQKVTDASVHPTYRVLAQALMGKGDVETFTTEIDKVPLQGNDLIALRALAAKRIGGEAWRTFRASARDLMGSQALDGNVVLLVSRLSSPTCRLDVARAAAE